jgi:putative ATP-dependent endonuclease of OLD family
VYRDLLRSAEGPGGDGSVSILLTTHSPHIVSVSPLNTITLLRKTQDGLSTEGVSTASLRLLPEVVADLERYLDVTRGEILFAKGVILVEGDAERFLVPALARAAQTNLDEYGISVCSIAGTHFAPYIALLGDAGLRIPVAVITDGDPAQNGIQRGDERVLALLETVSPPDVLAGRTRQDRLALARDHGYFVGEYTCEVDLFRCGLHAELGQTLAELAPGEAARTRAQRWQADPASLEPTQLLSDLDGIGKGRFAQRLSTRIPPGHCPGYITDAIEYVRTRAR